MSGESTVTLPVAAKPIGEALAVYCKRPAGETVDELFGHETVRAILDAPDNLRPSPRDPVRASLALSAIAAALICVALPISSMTFALVVILATGTALFAGQPWIEYMRDRVMNRHEKSRAELAALAGSTVQKRNIQSLEEFRRQIGNGSLKAYAVSPSGAVKVLAGKDLACFAADHGRVLLVSENHNDWFSVRARPIPQGEIWINLGGTIARSQLTAKSLIEEPDEDRYQRRVAWIREQAQERGQGSGALISGLAIIEAMRHPEVRGQPFTRAMPTIQAVLKGPAASESIINKMHSGNYPEFETALHALPLEDLP